MAEGKKAQRDKSSQTSYLLLVLGTLLLGGTATIALVYGPGALFTAVPLLLLGAGLILIPWLLLSALGRWRAHSERAARAALDEDKGARRDG